VKNPAAIRAFGIYVRQLREQRNLTQQELADLSDLARKTIVRIENGDSTTFDAMVSLARGLEISLEELVGFPLPKEI
jgi:transcriptional regulator with XRE-family HTH domain